MKNLKKTVSILFTVAMVLLMSVGALADDSSVIYEGGAEKYVFIGDKQYTESDTFFNFKNLMPGDSVTQEIIVKNVRGGKYYVNVYMRAIPHNETDNKIHDKVAEVETLASMEDFLSQLSMKVYNGKKLIYEASPDELDGLKNNVLLGKFYEGRGTTLTVELKVPETLGSEYAGRIGEVDWVFIAEEVPMPNPPTGDNSDLLLWGGAFIVAAAAVTVVIVTGKKKKAEKKADSSEKGKEAQV